MPAKDAAAFANEFKMVFTKAAESARQEKQSLESRLAQLKSNRDQLEHDIKELQQALEEVDSNIAVGLKHAALDAGVRLEIGNNHRQPSSESDRLTKDELSAAAEKIYRALPQVNGRYFSIGDLSSSTGLPTGAIKSALGRLKREKRAVSNGKRGGAGGWRRVS